MGRITFNGGTGHLRYITLRYGEYHEALHLVNVQSGQVLVENSNIVSNDNVAIFIENSRLVVRDTLINDNRAIGVYAYSNSSLEIYNSELRNNRNYGIWISNSHVHVDNTAFSGNGSGGDPYAEAVSIVGASSVVTLTNSTFQNNFHHPIKVEAGALPGTHLANNAISGNNPDRILIAGGTIARNTTLASPGAPFELSDDLVVAADAVLNLEPGVTVMGRSGSELRVAGSLQALGTSDQPVTFTSTSNSAMSQWSGIVFDGGIGNLDHVIVRYGGVSNSIGSRANVSLRSVLNGEVKIVDSEITNGYSGILVDEGHLSLADVTVSDIGTSTVSPAIQTRGHNTTLNMNRVTVRHNAGYGLYVENAEFDCRY